MWGTFEFFNAYTRVVFNFWRNATAHTTLSCSFPSHILETLMLLFTIVVALLLLQCSDGLQLGGLVSPVVKAAFHTQGVQKVLELTVIAGIGASMRSKLDAKALTALLLNTMVPASIVTSLSVLKASPELGSVFLAGALLAIVQLAAGEIASRASIRNTGKKAQSLRRTSALQLGTMAPGLSVLSFTREFVGPTWSGLAALADVPTKIYTLILIPYYLQFRGAKDPSAPAETKVIKPKKSLGDRVKGFFNLFKDPFNLSIFSGIHYIPYIHYAH